jgi:pimeloyl-ACP methyl ester carboxylesterase
LWAMPYLLPGSIRPFRWRFLANPKTRKVMNALIRQADLEDPQIRAAIEQWSFPLSIIHQVRRAGIEAVAHLEKLDLPVLIVQGRRDRTVWPQRTRKALPRLPRRPRYIEVEAGHDLCDTDLEDWDKLKEAVLEFAGEFLDEN